MSGILDRCVWLATSTGTGSFVDNGPIVGYQDMSAAGAVDGQVYSYAAQSADLTQWEVGLGTWTAATSTLARTTIYFNSLGGTSAINFSTVPRVIMTLTAVAARPQTAVSPGGRLTLVSGTPVMTTSETAKGVVYYTPYLHSQVTCWDGVGFSSQPFTELSVTLDSTNVLNGSIYDWFIFLHAGVPTLGYGPAWSSNTARSAALTTTKPYANNASITLRTSSSQTYTISAGQAFYVGTMYATANGQTGMQFYGFASGGGACVLGLYNAYNQVFTVAASQDSAASWTISSTTWRYADNSFDNTIWWMDGLGTCAVSGQYLVLQYTGSGDTAGSVGCAINWSSGAPGFFGQLDLSTDEGVALPGAVTTPPILGFNALSAIEAGQTSSLTSFYGEGYQILTLQTTM
jgi:hypothetical protein